MILNISTRKDKILSITTEEWLFSKYAGTYNGKIKCHFHEDRTASLSINFKYFKCFGCNKTGDIFDYIMLLYNTNYDGALNIIIKDLNLNKVQIISNTLSQNIIQQKDSNNIKWLIQGFQNKHIEYWKSYNIDINILNKYKVFPLSKIFKGDSTIYNNYKNNLAFLYQFNLGWKIYMPYVPKLKFLSSKGLIQGLHMLNFKETQLIITKSLKDVMFLYSIGYNAISPASENTIINQHIMKYLINKFDITLNFDNDQAGKKAIISYKEKYQLKKSLVSPYTKDFTDMILQYGVNKTKNLINEQINQNNRHH